jgi:hypothetical protein
MVGFTKEDLLAKLDEIKRAAAKEAKPEIYQQAVGKLASATGPASLPERVLAMGANPNLDTKMVAPLLKGEEFTAKLSKLLGRGEGLAEKVASKSKMGKMWGVLPLLAAAGGSIMSGDASASEKAKEAVGTLGGGIADPYGIVDSPKLGYDPKSLENKFESGDQLTDEEKIQLFMKQKDQEEQMGQIKRSKPNSIDQSKRNKQFSVLNPISDNNKE